MIIKGRMTGWTWVCVELAVFRAWQGKTTLIACSKDRRSAVLKQLQRAGVIGRIVDQGVAVGAKDWSKNDELT